MEQLDASRLESTHPCTRTLNLYVRSEIHDDKYKNKIVCSKKYWMEVPRELWESSTLGDWVSATLGTRWEIIVTCRVVL